MKGLFVKDWQLMKNQKALFVILAVMMALYVAMGDVIFALAYTPMICVFASMSTITYDTYDNGGAFLFTLPFSRTDYVLEKYIFTGVFIVAAWGVSFAVALGYTVFHGEGWKEVFLTSIVLLVITFLIMGVSIPVQLKFGAEKSRVAMIIVMGVGFGMLIAFFKMMEMDMGQVLAGLYSVNKIILSLTVTIIFVALMGISYVASVKIMMKKEM